MSNRVRVNLNSLKQAQSSDYSPLGYGDDDPELYSELERLHRLWYTINQLEGKMSDIANRHRQQAIADFYLLAGGVANKISERFGAWLNFHRLPGWWDRTRRDLRDSLKYFLSSKTKNPYSYEARQSFKIDQYSIPEQLTNILAQRYAEDIVTQMADIDLEQHVRDREIYYHAFEFLKSTGQMEDGITDDVSAFNHILEVDLIPEYTQYLKKVTDFTEDFNPINLYGSNWYEEMPEEFLNELMRADDLGQMAYQKFIERWPKYTQVANNVETSLKRLQSAMSNQQDIGAVMTALSLALNTAHNSGIMSEHVGLSEQEMDQLSNLDVSDINEKSKRYMSWVRDNCRFAK